MDIKIEKLKFDSLMRAIAIAGTASKLAALIAPYKPCKANDVANWKQRGGVGPSFVKAAVKALKGVIREWEFRPDLPHLFPREDV